MNYPLIQEFLQILCEKDPFQEKHLKFIEPAKLQQRGFEDFLFYFTTEKGESLQSLADSYLFLNEMIMQETYYFKRNKHYRNSTLREVEEDVYHNPDYMKKYMSGLFISDYLCPLHLEIIDYFDTFLSSIGGGYLEIGPGCGQLLTKAIQSERFDSLTTCDLSESSASLCNGFLEYLKLAEKCRVEVRDFFDFSTETTFDCIVMGEVLEHVEEPEKMLRKIEQLLKPGGRAFISTVVNAPAIDHIFLFSEPEDVLQMAERAGFTVEDFLCTTVGGETLDHARKFQNAIDIAMILSKKEN